MKKIMHLCYKNNVIVLLFYVSENVRAIITTRGNVTLCLYFSRVFTTNVKLYYYYYYYYYYLYYYFHHPTIICYECCVSGVLVSYRSRKLFFFSVIIILI
jgi:hypothetical protein